MIARTLADAVLSRRPERVRRALAAGADPDPPDGDTPLYLAAVHGDTATVRILLQAGADPDRESGQDRSLPLCAAACWGHTDTVGALLDGGAGPDRVEDVAWTALQWAAAGGHLGAATALLEGGADPDARAEGRMSALGHAAAHGFASVVRLLLRHGADPGSADAQGLRPVEHARAYAGKDLEAEVSARVFAGPGARVTVRRQRLEGGDEQLVAEARDADGDLRSGLAMGTGHAEIVRLLEAHG
ncbi:hypothetical protein GCM10009560_72540 [Nonomuraea longicatena]|uniref:Ankyrin repeat domain-containing protein n=2 Tax=Nonomuraea longicatena TaxID=83682 RepID=A0ABN1R6I8_9ACTN